MNKNENYSFFCKFNGKDNICLNNGRQWKNKNKKSKSTYIIHHHIVTMFHSNEKKVQL